MPALIPAALSAVAAAGAQWAAAGFVASAISWGSVAATFAVSAALTGYSMLTAKKSNPISSGYLNDRRLNVRNPITSHRVIYGQVKVGGAIVFIDDRQTSRTYGELNLLPEGFPTAWFPAAWENSVTGQLLCLVVVLAAHEVEEIGDVYFNDDLLTIDANGAVTSPTRLQAVAYVWKHTGATDQSACPHLQTLCPDKWTSNHRLRGHAYLVVCLRSSATGFPTSIPNISAIVKGKKVYDPRTETTAYSTNAALCLADYLTDTRHGLKAEWSEIDEDALIAAANICDEDIPLASGSTEKRYTCNGSYESSQDPETIIPALASAMAGACSWVGGLYKIRAGAYITPTVTIDESALRGSVSVQSLVSARDLFNSVKGTYYAPDQNWQATDFPPLESATYIAEDNGEQSWAEMTLGFTNSPSMAQRLAKIALFKVRQQSTVQLPCNLFAFQIEQGETFLLTLARYGWTAKPFVCTGWTFAPDTSGDGPGIGIDIVARETSSTVYDWSTDEESPVDPAPNTNLPSAFTVTNITGLALAGGTDELLKTQSGAIIPRIKASWNDLSTSDTGRLGKIEVQHKRSSDTTWTSDGFLSGMDTQTYIVAEDAETYNVRVRSVNGFGVTGTWAMGTIYVAGQTELPDSVAWCKLDGSRLKWAMTTVPADLAGYLVRYRNGSTVQWSDAVAMHGGVVTTTELDISEFIAGPSSTRVFMVKPVDVCGNEAATPGYVVANIQDLSIDNAYATIDDKALDWPGTKTNCAEDGDGNLAADVEDSLFWSGNDSDPFWTGADSDPFWNDTIKLATYVRSYTPDAAWIGYDAVLSVTVSADSWALYIYTDDGWTPFSGRIENLENKAYQIKLVINASGDEGIVSQWVLTCDMPTITEELEDVAIDSAGTRLDIVNTYHAIKTVILTVQYDGGNAITARPRDKAESGPLIECLDASGTACDGLVDARIAGY